jgi:collagenase-like PrtC family protease
MIGMKFSVGYQFFDEYENSFSKSLCEIAPHIEEVYFPWLDSATCRSSLINENGHTHWQAQEALEQDLKMLKQNGIELNLLLNANCYGEKAVSNYFQNYVCSIIEHIQDIAGGLDTVTTTSPFVAKVVKQYFPSIKTRASVNMRIGTIKGMQYLSDLFDGFYLQRDYNRDFERIKKIKAWADSNNKSLHILANSGCMRFCSAQTFHDNTVAHEKELCEINNKNDFTIAMCWDYYKNKENWVSLLQNTWIRPEDIHHYETYFSSVKLATRMTNRPLNVIKAYSKGEYRGNLLDLFEPNHSSLLGELYLSNKKFPKDWFEKSSKCKGECENCNYCEGVLKEILTKQEEVTVYKN